MNSTQQHPARTHLVRGVCLLFAASLAGGCSINEYIADKSAIDYKSAGKRPALEIPPDLVTPRGDERYAIPARPESTFSGYQRAAAGEARVGTRVDVLPGAEGARIERLGQQRWLVVAQPPEQVWTLVRDFWQENGFIIQTESPATGIIETDWAENRAKLPQDIIRRSVGRLFDGLYSTGERDKFRTRLERVPGGVEIYITHRRMVEIYADQRKESTIWQPAPSDPELEADFLARLLVKFGATTEQAAAKAAAPAAAPATERARLVTGPGGASRVEIAQGFDRAWRLVGLALDRGGFTVEDRDRSKGIYFVRYIDPEAEARQSAQPGFFARLFGSKRPEAAERFQVQLEGGAERVSVSVQGGDGNAVPEREKKTAARILTLLHEQLK